MKRWRKIDGRAGVRLAPPVFRWPDPAMVPTWLVRRCERAETIDEVRAIVHSYLPPFEEVPVVPHTVFLELRASALS